MRIFPAILIFLTLMCPVVRGQSVPFGEAEKKVVDDAVKKQMSQQGLVGVCVGVIADGKVVYTQSYGYEDRRKKIKANEKKTMFRWASISKPVTAMAALKLVDEGKLKLDDDVRKYVPEFPDKGVKVTVRHLLCHQSGIVHYSNGEVIRTKRKYKEKNPHKNVIYALDRFRESPLVYQPGEKYSYSTHAYILLSAVVQRAAKKPFAEYVDKSIAEPLSMSTFQPDYQWLDIPNRAVGYRALIQGYTFPVVSSDTDVSWKLGGGGFISNIQDLSRFGTALINKKILKEETYQKMWTPQLLNDRTKTEAGLGLFIKQQSGTLKVSHSGAQEKTRTSLVLYPEQGHGIAVMTNSENGDPGKISTAIHGALGKRKRAERSKAK